MKPHLLSLEYLEVLLPLLWLPVSVEADAAVLHVLLPPASGKVEVALEVVAVLFSSTEDDPVVHLVLVDGSEKIIII